MLRVIRRRDTGARMTRIDARVWATAALAAVACGGGKRETPDAAKVDAPGGGVLHVSPSGNNAADGFTSPVATLGKALQLATRTREPVDIELAAGTYTLGSPDILPYVVPSNVQTIAGPAGGGAILVGQANGMPPVSAVILTAGAVRDLELRNFATAIEVRGVVELSNLRVVDSGTAVETNFNEPAGTRKVHIEHLDVTNSTPSRCAVALALTGTSEVSPSEVSITGLTTHDVGGAVFASTTLAAGHATVDIDGAEIVNTISSMPCNAAVFELRGVALALRNSTVAGGTFGFNFYDNGQLTIEHSTIRSTSIGLLAFGGVVHITDTVFTANGTTFLVQGGDWTMTGVNATGNQSPGTLESQGSDPPLTVTMRGSTLANNKGDGLQLRGHVTADFGTTASPGNNIIRGNTGVGLSVLNDTVWPQITAAGNTWNANLQGADADGKYIVPATIAGPIATTAGNNFALPAQANLVR